jgi:hypothetical protein
MSSRPRRRFWLLASLAALSAVLLLLTALQPDWIEGLASVDPDQGDGSVERLLTIASLGLTIVFTILGTVEWMRPATTPATD